MLLNGLHRPTSYSQTVLDSTLSAGSLANSIVGIREELRPQNLSFTDIAKRVGENWQVLLAEGKEPYESQASAAKEKYHAEMAKYKKTDAYKEYALYLAEFKAKNASNAGRRLYPSPKN